ncbi:MAG: extracellular solute-binding protein [Lachnospiraceae bacterium]|nr:extracellular solute-binding protein [Lachnospiraceae bacterium]
MIGKFFKSFGKHLVLAFAAFSCLMLTGCHASSGNAGFQMPEEFDTSKDIEITFWAKNDTNKAQTTIYEESVTAFEEIYPNIKVNLRFYTDYGKIYNDVITNIATNTTPNVCITYPDHIATYLTGNNQVLCLSDLIDDPKYGLGGSEVNFDAPEKDEVVSKYLEECEIGGKLYALPYMRSSEALYVNKTYVEKLGYELPDDITWDFIWEVSEEAMKKDGDDNFVVNGQKVLIPFIYKSTDNMMIQLLKQNGYDYTTEAGDVLLFNDDTKGILEEIAVHAGTKSFSTFKISSYPGNFLNAGQCIFAIDSTAGATWMGPEAPLSDICSDDIISDIDVVVRRIPQVDPSNPLMISQGPSVCVFNKEDPQEVLASWLFTQFLLTNDVQIPYAETEGYVPVTLKAQNSAEYLDYLSRGGENNTTYYSIKIDATKMLLDNIENTFITPVFNGSASVRDAAGQLIENTSKSMRRKQTVDDAYFEKLYDDIISLYRLDQLGAAAGASSGQKPDLGPLPAGAKALIIALLSVWALILLYFCFTKIKGRRNNK